MVWSCVVYRGAGLGTPHDPGDLGIGLYYSTSKSYAKQYGVVRRYRVTLQNPLILQRQEAEELVRRFGTLRGSWEERTRKSGMLTSHLLSLGHDGLVAYDYETSPGHAVVVVFSGRGVFGETRVDEAINVLVQTPVVGYNWEVGRAENMSLIEEIENEITKLLCEAKRILYHGTSSVNLHDILTRGLIPQPKKRVWTLERNPLLASYPGIYFAMNFGDAAQYAQAAIKSLGGNPIIVIAQIEERHPATVADEDWIPRGFLPFTGRSRADVAGICAGIIGSPEDQSRMVSKAVERLIEKWSRETHGIMSREKCKYQQDLIEQFVKAMAKVECWRWYSQTHRLPEGIDNVDELARRTGVYQDVVRQMRELTDKLVHKLYKIPMVSWQTTGRVFPLHVYRTTVRVTEPVTFRGANKILGVVELIYRSDQRKDAYVRYGGLDSGFRQWLGHHGWKIHEEDRGFVPSVRR